MTPEERNLVTELFDRLATLEDAQRDADAERAIRDGLRQAPNAVYSLVQTVLVQDEALKRADARIRELEENTAPPRDTSFLGGMRDSLFGGRGEDAARQPVAGVEPRPRADAARGPDERRRLRIGWQLGSGGSFLGTAAAAAAGVIGGSLLLGGIRSAMGGGGSSAHAAYGSGGGSPVGR